MSVYFEGNAYIDGGQIINTPILNSTIQNSYISGFFGPITTSSLYVSGQTILNGGLTTSNLNVIGNALINSLTVTGGTILTSASIGNIISGNITNTNILTTNLTSSTLNILSNSVLNGLATFSVSSLLVNTIDILPNTGDIVRERSFNAANNVSSPLPITSFSFGSSVRSFDAQLSVSILTAGDLNNRYAIYNLLGIRKFNTWQMHSSFVGDKTGLVFTINTSGQMLYTSPNITNFISNTLKFKARTTTV